MGSSGTAHLILFAILLLYLEGLSAEVPAGSTKVLHCDASLPNLLRRTWTKGYFNTSYPPTDNDILFVLIAPPGPLTRVNARDDMTVDTHNFTLTIGDIKYEDAGYFTCVAEDFVGAKCYVQSEEIVVDASTVLEVEKNSDAVFRWAFEKESSAMRFFLRGIHQKIPSDDSMILLRQLGNQLPELPSKTQNLSVCLPEFNLELHKVTAVDSGFYSALQMSKIGDLSFEFIKLVVNGLANITTSSPTTGTPEATTITATKVYIDCQDAYAAGMTTSGVYRVSLNSSNIIDVYCDQEIDDGGWTVFQRRMDGSVDFYRDWADYQKGFGNLNTEFWLGNDNLHLLTYKHDHKLKVELNYHGQIAYANYSFFWIEDEDAKYKLHVSGFDFAHPPGDSLVYLNSGCYFTTRDNDNDKGPDNCADVYHGAWWYSYCGMSNLNGVYGKNEYPPWNIYWESFKFTNAMTATRMLAKRR